MSSARDGFTEPTQIDDETKEQRKVLTVKSSLAYNALSKIGSLKFSNSPIQSHPTNSQKTSFSELDLFLSASLIELIFEACESHRPGFVHRLANNLCADLNVVTKNLIKLCSRINCALSLRQQR